MNIPTEPLKELTNEEKFFVQIAAMMRVAYPSETPSQVNMRAYWHIESGVDFLSKLGKPRPEFKDWTFLEKIDLITTTTKTHEICPEFLALLQADKKAIIQEALLHSESKTLTWLTGDALKKAQANRVELLSYDTATNKDQIKGYHALWALLEKLLDPVKVRKLLRFAKAREKMATKQPVLPKIDKRAERARRKEEDNYPELSKNYKKKIKKLA